MPINSSLLFMLIPIFFSDVEMTGVDYNDLDQSLREHFTIKLKNEKRSSEYLWTKEDLHINGIFLSYNDFDSSNTFMKKFWEDMKSSRKYSFSALVSDIVEEL